MSHEKVAYLQYYLSLSDLEWRRQKKSINRLRRLVVIQGNLKCGSAPTKQVTLQDYVQQKWQSMRNANVDKTLERKLTVKDVLSVT